MLECRLNTVRLELALAKEKEKEQNQKKLIETKQRSLLENRLKFERQRMANVKETRRFTAELDEKRAKESKQRSIFGYRLSIERQIVNRKMAEIKAELDQEEAKQRAKLEHGLTLERQIVSRKMAEIKQRSLLESRLSRELNQKIVRAGVEAIVRIEDEKLRAEAAEYSRVKEDERLARIDEQIRLEEESRLVEVSRIEALAHIEKNRRAKDTRLRAEMEAMNKIESEKRLAMEHARLASLDKQTRLDEASGIAEMSRIEDLALIKENRRYEETIEDVAGPIIEDTFLKDIPSNGSNDPVSKAPTSIDGMMRDDSVLARELPWVDRRSSSPSVEVEAQKPNVDVAKALLESVRKAESYQFKREWWE